MPGPLTRATLSARIERAERRRAELVADVEHFDHRSRMEGDEGPSGKAHRKALRAQYDLYAGELMRVEHAIREDRAAYDAITERLQGALLLACIDKDMALYRLLDAECVARDAGETALADE